MTEAKTVHKTAKKTPQPKPPDVWVGSPDEPYMLHVPSGKVLSLTDFELTYPNAAVVVVAIVPAGARAHGRANT
jgi:hypothetical protein